MKTINVLLLDDNFIIANKIKKRIFEADSLYKFNSNFHIHTYYQEIDNSNVSNGAEQMNLFIKSQNIEYLLLDRGFGKIVDPEIEPLSSLDNTCVYKDNSVKGYNVEELLLELKNKNNSNLNSIKGILIYTYDDYRTINKEGEIIREEIIGNLETIIPKNCYVDILLTYSSIYKIANKNLYFAFNGHGVFKLGRKDDFQLYGIFIGELLYHKLSHVINIKKFKILKERKKSIILKIIILYLIVISINVGSNALYSLIFEGINKLYGFVSILFALILPLIVLKFLPGYLIDFDDKKNTD